MGKASFRFIFRHIVRQTGRTVLMLLLTLIFVMSVVCIRAAIDNNRQNIDTLYKTVSVTGEIVQSAYSREQENYGGGFIYPATVDKIAASPYIESMYSSGAMHADIDIVSAEYIKMGDELLKKDSAPQILAINDFENFKSGAGKSLEIGYLPGYDESLFTSKTSYSVSEHIPVVVPYQEYGDENILSFKVNVGEASCDTLLYEVVGHYRGAVDGVYPYLMPYAAYETVANAAIPASDIMLYDDIDEFTSQTKGVNSVTFKEGHSADENSEYPSVIAPKSLYDALNIETDGAYMRISNEKSRTQAIFEIVGSYESESIDAPLIRTSDARECGFESGIMYSVARFTLKPDMNRNIDEFREDLASIIERGGITTLDAYISDSELKDVVKPLENTIELLSVLQPIVLAVTGVITAAVCALMVNLSSKDAAIMRAQGVSRFNTGAALALQTVGTMLVGLALSVVFMYTYSCISGSTAVMEYMWLAAVVYISAGVIGSLVSALIVSGKDVLSLLGVKE